MTLKHVSLFIITLFLLGSCKEKTPDNIYKFKDFVSYTTTGNLSSIGKININLTKDVEGWDIEKEISSSIISSQPHISGKLICKNKHIIEFIPDEPLEPDTTYNITVNLGEIYPEAPSELKKYTFQFKTLKPNFNVTTKSLQSYSKAWQFLLGDLKSADFISLDDAKQLLNASQNGKKLNVEWEGITGVSRHFEFKIDSIKREIDDSEILVKWNGKPIKADNVAENTVAIPGQNNFKIVKAEVIQSPEQYLSLNFSDPIKKDQNFDGLVTIQNAKNPNFVVDGNTLKVYPGSKIVGSLQVDVFQGIKNTSDFKLKQPFSETIAFEDVKPQVRLVNSGVILPNSEALNFNFEAVNLKAVDVRVIKIFEDNVLQFLQDNNLDSGNSNQIRHVGRRVAKQTINLVESDIEDAGQWKSYAVDLSKLIKADPGAIYRVEISYNRSYSLYDCESNPETSNGDEEEYYENDYYEDDYYEGDYAESNTEDDDLREEEYWDNLTYNYRNYSYNWNQRNNPCHDAYYNDETIITQNILASNLGIIAKKGANNTYYFAATNILNTNTEANTSIKLYNYQQQEIARTQTDSEGLASIATDKHAAFAIATKNNNSTYIKLKDGNALSLSKFDVSGSHLQKGIKGYLYGERGVWRPGDSLHLTFMLNDKTNPLPKNHPVKLEVTDPNGKLTYKNVKTTSVDNFYYFNVPTSTSSKTGHWNAKVSVGGATFYKGLKIETVKPNRLKLKVDFDDETLSSIKPITGKVDVKWLHGAPAKNLRTEITAKFSNSYSSFKNYKDYRFRDPSKSFSGEEITFFDDKVDADGLANISKSLSVGEDAPGMLNVQFLVRAFENGGDFSMDAFSKKYAPYKSFVGMKSPKGKAYGSFLTDENQTFDIVVVDDQGKPIKRTGLEVKIFKIEWRWWWSSSYDNLSKYTSGTYHRPYKSFKLNTGADGKTNFSINIPEDDNGRYLIRVYDPKSGHATGRTAYFYKNWWRMQPSNDKESAKMLVFSSDKSNYNVGEIAKLTFPSGTSGRALVSIENGTEVIRHTWVKTEKGETTVDVPITPEMAPNVFVNISLLQPHASTANDLPLRLYGVIPLLVENPSTKLEPEIRMPSVLKPEEEFAVIVSEKNNKSMTYSIAMVEEGLLDLTRFKTPNAWDEFYKREALGVKTWDVFDDVIGAYSGSIEQVFAVGGDGEADGGKNKKANRFKPVVTYLGPFTLQAGDRKTHTIKMPNYIGAVRTMVVAGNSDTEAYGSTDKSVQVKKPLMVLASLPRKLSPGEKVTLPVTVFAMEPHIKNVSLSLKLGKDISVVGDKSKSLSFAKPDEQMAYFELDVSKANGVNTIEVLASGNGETSTYKVELDVVNPNPITSKALDSNLEANASETVSFSTFGVPGSNTASIEFSTLPPMDFSGRLQYLIQYPHGCVEQTTSSVFPQLYLKDIFDLPFEKTQQIEDNIKKGITRLGNFQRPSGGMSYWIGENAANDWGTSYAGHFLIEAEKKGYVLPLSFKSNWVSYQKQAARDWRPSYRNHNSDLAQAYRLYTLALAGHEDLASMNRLREFSELSNEAKWRLAASYALVGQTEASNAIIKTANIEFKAPKYNYYTYGSLDRNRAMALETMVITKDDRRRDLSISIAKALSGKSWMSTQTTAYSLLAMAKMVNANGGKGMDLSYTIGGKSETINSKSAIALRDVAVKDGQNNIQLKNNRDNVVFVRVLNSGKLPLGEEINEQRGLSVSVTYKDTNGNAIDIDELQQGQDFVATVVVSNLKDDAVRDVALTQIFPSGWEIVNTRFTDFGSATTSQARFTDIRDDRVNFYFDLNKNGKYGSKTFNVMLNASYLGTYYLPGVQAEAMYDDEFLVRTKGQWVKIVK